MNETDHQKEDIMSNKQDNDIHRQRQPIRAIRCKELSHPLPELPRLPEVLDPPMARVLSDDRDLAMPPEELAETLDLSGPGVEETEDLPRWSQRDVAQWADTTFGPSPSNARIAARANEEMAELLRALTCDDNAPKAIEEAADVVIVLYRLVERMGGDLMQAIDAKMAVNRDRKWIVSGGHGQHVRTREG